MTKSVSAFRVKLGDKVAYRLYKHTAESLQRIWRTKHGEKPSVDPVKVTKDDLAEHLTEDAAERTWNHWTADDGGHGQ